MVISTSPTTARIPFIAIDAGRTAGGAGIAATVSGLSDGIRQSRRAPGVDVVYAPGDLERARGAKRTADAAPCRQDVAGQLNQLARARPAWPKTCC